MSRSPDAILFFIRSPNVDKDADDWGGSAPPRAHDVGHTTCFSSLFDGFQVNALLGNLSFFPF